MHHKQCTDDTEYTQAEFYTRATIEDLNMLDFTNDNNVMRNRIVITKGVNTLLEFLNNRHNTSNADTLTSLENNCIVLIKKIVTSISRTHPTYSVLESIVENMCLLAQPSGWVIDADVIYIPPHHSNVH